MLAAWESLQWGAFYGFGPVCSSSYGSMPAALLLPQDSSAWLWGAARLDAVVRLSPRMTSGFGG